MSFTNLVHDSILLIVGEGPERERVQKIAVDRGIESQVIMVGIPNDVATFYQAMDVFIFPSLHEGFGIAAIEAQASGLPCILSEVLPTKTVITECTRQMSIHCSACDWASEIVELSHLIRKDQTDSIRNAGFDSYASFDKLLCVYKEVVRR